MLLPQSSAFAALKNRLNSVSAIGYLHTIPRAYVSTSLNHRRQKSTEAPLGSTPPTPTVGYDRPNRLKTREDGSIKWVELLDKFKAVQEKARRAKTQTHVDDIGNIPSAVIEASKEKELPEVPKQQLRPESAGSGVQRPTPPSGPMHKPKSSLGKFGRLTGGVGSRSGKK